MAEQLECITRLRIRRDGNDMKSVFGHGTAQLLEGVRELQSLNKAAKQMNMAYSKAWNSIRATEAHLGFPLLERRAQQGSVLTEEGERFLALFLEAEAAAQQAAEKVFENW